MPRNHDSLRRISASEFARRLKQGANDQDRHYVFWLGAGCSVSSGIPASTSLVRDIWLPRLRGLRDPTVSIETWAKATFPQYQPDTPGLLYGPLMNELFPHRDERQRETERLCEGRVPGFGYAILASLMSRSDGIFNTALTTNFDDLVADAMYVFGDRRPLVIQHESLSGFARPGRVQRPLVVKIHGDHRLNPMHTDDEIAALKKSVADGVRGVLQDRGVIFVGYSGNDQGVIEALEALPDNALPLGTWWISRNEPSSAISEWLRAREAVWVEASGFDEFMLLLREEFEIPHPTAARFEGMIDGYRETYTRLNAAVNNLSESSIDSEPLKEAAKRASTEAPEWWQLLLDASDLEATKPDEAEQIYERGVGTIEDPRFLGSYALFLTSVRRNHDRAQELYERASTTDPKDATTLASYADFLTSVRGDDDRAQQLYEEAITANPNSNYALTSYAVFLVRVRKDHNHAQELFGRAVAANPNSDYTLASYADFLTDVRKDYEQAQELYEQAITANPEDTTTLSGYAGFLTDVREDYDRAREFYEQAITINPRDATTLASYADFLINIDADIDRAQKLFEQAIAANPNSDYALASYADFLSEVRADYDRAQELNELAIAANPRSSYTLTNYALLLTRIRKDYDRAEELYEQAIAANPESVYALTNYADFLADIRKDQDRASELHERADSLRPITQSELPD